MSSLAFIESYVGKRLAPIVLEILEESNASLQDEGAIQEAHNLAILEEEL